jgi:hypothetical protein
MSVKDDQRTLSPSILIRPTTLLAWYNAWSFEPLYELLS